MDVVERKLPNHGLRDGKTMPAGPWDDEPDKVQWPDKTTGMACLARRGPLGAWCGYVGVPEGHPAYGKPYDEVKAPDGDYLDVHGGLTFAALCDGDEENGICHVPGPGEPDPLYWFGFDCAHSFDLIPAFLGMKEVAGLVELTKAGTYRDLEYVKAECAKLAAQLAA